MRYIENRKILTVAITVSITNMIFILRLFVFKMAPCSGRRKFKKLSGVDTQMCTFVVAMPILRHV